MVDLVTYVNRMPVKGETVEAPRFEMGHGGKGANQAVAAAKLGAEVVMVTAVGDDLFGDNTIKNLAALGIDTTLRASASPASRAASRRSWSSRAARTPSSSSRAPTPISRPTTSSAPARR